MDLNIDEWDLLSEEGFLDFSEHGEKKLSKSVFDMNYFICPSQNPLKITESPRNPRLPDQILPVPFPIRLEPRFGKTPDDDLDLPKGIITANPVDQDTVSQVFFKMKENEFVDMKMDSPRSGTRGMFPPFDDKGEAMEILSPRLKIEKEMLIDDDDEEEEEDNEDDGFNLWKWSFTGIGAICSFGVAAATICVLFFGSHQRNKLQQHKIRFQIYADDKVSLITHNF